MREKIIVKEFMAITCLFGRRCCKLWWYRVSDNILFQCSVDTLITFKSSLERNMLLMGRGYHPLFYFKFLSHNFTYTLFFMDNPFSFVAWNNFFSSLTGFFSSYFLFFSSLKLFFFLSNFLFSQHNNWINFHRGLFYDNMRSCL